MSMMGKKDLFMLTSSTYPPFFWPKEKPNFTFVTDGVGTSNISPRHRMLFLRGMAK